MQQQQHTSKANLIICVWLFVADVELAVCFLCLCFCLGFLCFRGTKLHCGNVYGAGSSAVATSLATPARSTDQRGSSVPRSPPLSVAAAQ